MGTQEPPSPGPVLGAWVTGPDFQGSNPLQQCQQGTTPSCKVPCVLGIIPGRGLGSPGEVSSPSFAEIQEGGIQHSAGWLQGPAHTSAGTQRPPTDRASPTCSSETSVTPHCHPLSLLPPTPPGAHLPPVRPAPSPGTPRGTTVQGQYWLSGTRGPVLGGHRPGHRPGPKKGGGGGSRGAGAAAFPAPSAPTLAPAAAWATQLTSFANCSSLRAPAARPGAPPASGGAGAGWGGG